MQRPKSNKYLNAKHKPSAKGKVAPDINVGDKFVYNGDIFEVVSIDPESNLPYKVKYLNLGYAAEGSFSYSTVKSCQRVV